MNFKDMYSGIWKNVSQKVYLDIFRKIGSLYDIEKKHTIVFMPFFGLLHIYGNEIHPILDFGTVRTLEEMNFRFKQLYVYRGETEALYGNNSPKGMEILAKKQWILSKILNQVMSFSDFTQNYNDKINMQENEKLYDTFKDLNCNYSELIEKYALPYKTIFQLQNVDDIIDYIDTTLREAQKEDELTKVLLIYPSFWIDRENEFENFKKIEEYIKSINGILYYAGNFSGGFVKNDLSKRYDYKSVCTIQHFAKVYCEDIHEQIVKMLSQSISPEDIKNGVFGDTEELIRSNIEKISSKDLYTKQFIKDCKQFDRK